MESLSRLKPFAPLPFFSPINSAPFTYKPASCRLLVCNCVKKKLDNRKLVLHFSAPKFGQIKLRKIQRDIIARSEIASSSTSSSDNSSHVLTDSQLGARIRGIFFYLTTGITAIPLFLTMVIIHPFILSFDRYRRRLHYSIASIWASLTIFPFYKFEIDGLQNLPPNTVPSVYVSNHQSFLDIYTLLTLNRCFKFISKRSIFVFPIIGWAMFLMGVIPLRRMDSRSQLDCLKRCMDLVRKGASVFFFPEGTRSKDGKLGAFKKGAFSVAAKTGVPVVPITLMGTGKLMPTGHEGIIHSGPVKVIIHKPIQGSNAEDLCDEARSVIAESLISHGYGVH
ncbi:hypothetical protein LUZ60_016515 [Juncus effusus]|nr:hypothetical protein LUZ60_016515 [Juncus effusus]